MAILLGYVDTAMLSGYNENAVGSIGNANTILGFLTLTFTIVSSATGILTAQFLGAKVKDKLNQVYTVSILFNLLLSVLVSAVLFIFKQQLLDAINVPTEIQADASTYIEIVGGLIFAHSIFSTFDQIFRNNGKTKIGMILALLMNLINIVGDYSVLYGPLKSFNFGVAGVAGVTAISRIVMMIVCIVYFVLKIEGSISLKYLKPFPKDILKKLLSLGIPTAGENICYNLSQITIVSMVNTFGIVAINTRVFCNMLFSFSYLFPLAMAMGTAIIVGHSVGAMDYDFAYSRVNKSLRWALSVSIVIAVLNFLLSGVTLGSLSDNPEVISLGHNIMFIGIFLEFGRTTNIVIINSMKAAGDVKFPTILGMCSMWGISVLGSFVLGKVLGLGLCGIWIAMAGDEIFRGVVVAIRWRRGKWREKRLVN
jgi:putative MATE family efflux protein